MDHCPAPARSAPAAFVLALWCACLTPVQAADPAPAAPASTPAAPASTPAAPASTPAPAAPAAPVLEARPIPVGDIQVLQMPIVHYPEEARQAKLGGTCAIRIRADEQGVPYGVEAPDCPPKLRMPALSAALSARVAPWLVDGQPARTEIVWTVEFRAADLTVDGSITGAAVLLPAGSSDAPDVYERSDRAQAPVVHVRDAQVKIPPPTIEYPKEARQMSIEGRCVIRLKIDEEGVPFGAEARACTNVFRDPSLRAALASRFYPYLVGGEPVRVQFDWAFNYKLLK